jgi:fructose-bisphosphate aldolase class II
MALISLRQMLDHAAEHGYGVPAFNVNNLEQMRAIMEAADETDSPVIVQASAGARKYAGAPFLRHLILSAIEEWPHIPWSACTRTTAPPPRSASAPFSSASAR